MGPTWRIWLSEAASKAIVTAAANHHPLEVGGVLVGVSVAGRPWVTEAVTVPSEMQTHSYYELPRGSRHAVVDAARNHDSRIGYIGDWHAHPADIGPSQTDLDTMRALASDPEAHCRRPVLLIARRRGTTYDLDVRQFTGRRLRRLRVIAAGPLSPADELHLARPRRVPRPKHRLASRPRGH